MIKQKRYDKILGILEEQNAASIDEFCERLEVSKATIRRDLIFLDEQKLLRRTHGGAVSLVKSVLEDVPISLRHHLYKTEKERIAQAALGLIEDGRAIYIGTGTTMRELATRLDTFSRLTVITNDIGVAYEISQKTSHELIVSGGKLETATATLGGPLAANALTTLHVDIAFMSAEAVTPDGFMDLSIEEAAIKRLMIANARRTVMLCDQSKFGAEAFVAVCPLSAAALTITNGEMNPKLEKKLLDAGIHLRSV